MRIAILISLLFTQFTHLAQIKWSDFDEHTYYAEKDGLSSSNVYNIIEDNDGFLWIGSEKGVSRFDGSTFVNFPYYYEDGIPEIIGEVSEIVLDNKGKYIYITSRSGVLMSSLKEIEFKHIKSFYPSLDFEVGNCKSLYADQDSNLWVGLSGKGLLKIALNSDDHELIQFQTIDKSKKEFDKIFHIISIVPDNENSNILWLGTSEGLIEFKKTTRTYKIHYYKDSQELFQRYITEILPIDDKLYIGTNGANWYIFDKNNSASHQILNRDSELSHHYITGIHQDDNSNIWFTSPYEGLVQYDPKSKTIVHGASNNYENGIVRGITLVDSRGLIWFTGEHGLFKYNPDPSARFIDVKKKNETESPTPIVSIVQVGDYYYVCPAYGLDLYKINAKDFGVSVIPVLPLRQDRNYSLRDMIKMQDNKLLVLGNKIAFILDTDSDSFSEPTIQMPDISEIYFRTIAKDKNENYWVGTNKNGLYKINYNNLTFKKYKDLFKGRTGRDHLFIKTLFVDSQNKLWIGQASTSVMDLEDNSLHCLNPDFDYDHYIPFGDFAEDKNRRIWVANIFDGISYVDPSKVEFGLNKVLEGSYSGVFKYNDSLLWTVGDGQLGVLNTNTLSHQKLKLKTENYFTGPIVDIGNGDFMVGCENGILVYNPQKHIQNQDFPRTYVQEIKANNYLWYNGANFNKNEFLFHSGTKSLSVKVGALVFQDPQQTTYQYKFDDVWVDLGASKEINLSNLKQGSYNLEVKAINGLDNGLEPTIYSFVIEPYWYTSNLAYILYALIVFGIMYSLYYFNLNRRLALSESRRIREIDELKSKMYANISHEFRTPLTIIKGLSGMLLKKNDNPENKELVRGIDQSNDQLLNLVNQMLDLASLDANKMEVNYKTGDIIAFIRKTVDLYRSYSDSRLQALEFNTTVHELTMDFDDDKLQKILNNLLSNAIKFTPEGGSIKVDVSCFDNRLRIKISDTGDGIRKKDLSHVFERYFTTSDNTGLGGSGIGLSISKDMVILLGGTIKVESKKSKGTVFVVELPIKNEATDKDIGHHLPFIEKKVLPSKDQTKIGSKAGLQTILVVEDNPEIQNFVTAMLSPGYKILTANNGDEGLEIAKKKDIDFIISDVMMPKMDGFEFCAKIKSLLATSHIPFIMLSARTYTKDKQKAYKLGVDAYLTKPFNVDELKLIIKNLLDKQNEQKQQLLQLLSVKNPVLKSASISKLDLDLITELQKTILKSSSKLSADVITKQLLISRSQLHRKVKSLTGKSLTQYANHIRLEKAKHLLKTTNLQIKEIAFSVGFESSTYFIRLFRNEVGVTPVYFRETT